MSKEGKHSRGDRVKGGEWKRGERRGNILKRRITIQIGEEKEIRHAAEKDRRYSWRGQRRGNIVERRIISIVKEGKQCGEEDKE